MIFSKKIVMLLILAFPAYLSLSADNPRLVRLVASDGITSFDISIDAAIKSGTIAGMLDQQDELGEVTEVPCTNIDKRTLSLVAEALEIIAGHTSTETGSLRTELCKLLKGHGIAPASYPQSRLEALKSAATFLDIEPLKNACSHSLDTLSDELICYIFTFFLPEKDFLEKNYQPDDHLMVSSDWFKEIYPPFSIICKRTKNALGNSKMLFSSIIKKQELSPEQTVAFFFELGNPEFFQKSIQRFPGEAQNVLTFGKTLISFIESKKHISKIESWLKTTDGFDVNFTDSSLRTPLHVASCIEISDILDFVLNDVVPRFLGELFERLSSEIETDTILKKIYSAKHVIISVVRGGLVIYTNLEQIFNYRANVMSKLLEYKADPNALDQELKTPLMLAVENRDKEAANILLQAGADEDLLNGAGQSAWDIDPNFMENMTHPTHRFVACLLL